MSWDNYWGWLGTQPQSKQAEAYYAKEKQIFHKTALVQEAMERWERENGKTANANNKAILENKRIKYRNRQAELRSKASQSKSRTQGYLASFSGFINKYINGTEPQVGIIPLLPLVIVCLTAAGTYVVANYIEHAQQANFDEKQLDELLKTYEKTKDPEILKAITDINKTKDDDEVGVFGSVISTVKTAGTYAAYIGLGLVALWVAPKVITLVKGAQSNFQELRASI